MEALRKTTLPENKESLLMGENRSNRCGSRVIKCLSIIIFLSGASSLSFYVGVKYASYLEDNSESL
jgi:hypothetical protein